MKNLFQPKIYFYVTSTECSHLGAKGAWFQDLIINLADGFRSLGVPYYASFDYWKLSPFEEEYLIKASLEVTHHDCDIVILERQWFEQNRALPKDLFKPNRKYITVFLDCSDGIRTYSWLPEFRQFDLILKPHYIERFDYPSNVYPWAFGLSSRVLKELKEYRTFENREQKILINFRHVKKGHSVRKYVEKTVLPKLHTLMSIDSTTDDVSRPPEDPYHNLRWVQTGRRHYPSYYQRLQSSTACSAFGGFFLGPKFLDKNPKLSYYYSRAVDELGTQTKRISQWDSWRLWESLAAGCVTLHADFSEYGFVLPEMPKNWIHYIGVSLSNIDEVIDRIHSQPDILEKISYQGRDWAIKNYSPEAVSKRFLQIIFDKFKK